MNFLYFVPPLLLVGAVFLGLAVGRITTVKGWRRCWQHKCGRVVDSRLYADGRPCETCGEEGRDGWKSGVARDVFPWGYEWKDEQ